jgi:hypothetical protein
MPKRSTSRRMSRGRGRSRSYRGGAYSDAQSYMLSTVGDTNTQYNNVFRQGGMNHSQSNAIMDQVTGQRAGRRRSMVKRGGSWVSDAVVPAALLAGSYLYSRRRGNNSYRKRSFRRRR